MSQLIDPNICPDCRADLDATATCTGCGLVLAGRLATRLWQTMNEADGLVEALRAASPVTATIPVTIPGTIPGAPLTGPAVQHLPPPAPGGAVAGAFPPPPVPRAAPPRGLDARSVPAILFGVGALCLLVAAVVFVAVAWSSLGLGARTTILLAVTAAFAAETFWLVVSALVTIDLSAAYGAGLLGFDDVPARHAVATIGAVLIALGLGTALWSRRTELSELIAPAVIVTGGTVLLTAAEAWGAPAIEVATTISVLLLVGAALAARAIRLQTIAYSFTGIALLSWAVLFFAGLIRAADSGLSALWGDGDGWPLLAAAVLAGACAVARPLPDQARIAAAGAAELTLALLVISPGAAPDTELLLVSGTAVALAAVAALGSRVWAAPATVFTALAAAAFAAFVLLRPLGTFDGLPTTGPADSANLDLKLLVAQQDLATWTAIVVAVVLAVITYALTRVLDDPAVQESATRTWQVAAPVVVALGLTTAVLETEPTLLVAVVAWTAVLLVLGLLAAVLRGAEPISLLVLTGYLAVAGLRLAVPSHLLVALLATALALGLAAACRITLSAPAVRAAMAGMSVLAVCFAATHWPYVVGGRGDAAGLTLAVVAVLAGLLAARSTRSAAERIVVEVIALVAGLSAVAFPVDDGVITIVLTLVGTGVALVSVLHEDRDQAGWLGAVILGVAALLRIDADLAMPELATGPAAALLLVFGVRRLITDDRVGSLRALGSGLTLALLPTLLITLEDPVSLRAVVVGMLALAALSIGIQRRWAAPFLAGAGTLAVLAVRHLGPVAEGLPRWISLGSVGIGLLAVAVTWESRRRELATAQRYLGSLR